MKKYGLENQNLTNWWIIYLIFIIVIIDFGQNYSLKNKVNSLQKNVYELSREMTEIIEDTKSAELESGDYVHHYAVE